jgi:copper homeostasis protein CutC
LTEFYRTAESADWAEKYELLDVYEQTAQPEIEILAGGGVDAEAIKLLLEKTSVREFHAGSAVRMKGKVDKSKVRELARALGENYD